MEHETWGFRFNQELDFTRARKGEKIMGCPEWLEPFQLPTWGERGLVLWNTADHKIETLRAHEALRLLKQLESGEHGKLDGISVTRLVTKIEAQLPPRGRRKKDQPPPETKSTSQDVYIEIIHLPAEAGQELMEFLRAQKSTLLEMAKRDAKERQDVLTHLLVDMLKWSREREMREFDFSQRSMSWERTDVYRWTCQAKSAEGRVCFQESLWHWHACVKQRSRIAKSQYFAYLKDAVEWMENELTAWADEPQLDDPPSYAARIEQVTANRARLRHELSAGPYWIDPLQLEPKQASYRVLIELDAEPVSARTYQSMCGGTFRYDKHYLSPAKMSQALNLDPDRFLVEQPVGENTEWYRITSSTAYYQHSTAEGLAQEAWDRSQILMRFQAGSIQRARFGYEEAETGYGMYLGACEHAENPWSPPESREEHMQERALRESLCFALDVNDFRDFLGLTVQESSDEDLLDAMHRTRARSRFVPEQAQRESRIWLAEHDRAVGR